MMDIEQVKERIRKLLVRTEDRGATPGEAAAAIELAQKLMAKHKLSADAIGQARDGQQSVQLGTRRPQFWAKCLASSIAKAMECKAWQRDHRRGAVFTFTGPEHRSAVASWLYQTVANDLYKAATSAARGNGCRGAEIIQYRCSFLEAATSVIHERLIPPRQLTAAEKAEIAASRQSNKTTSTDITADLAKLKAMFAGWQCGQNVSLATNAVGSPDERKAIQI